MHAIIAGVPLLLVVILALPVANASAAPNDQSGFAAQVLNLTNVERQNAGLPALAVSPQLQAAAQSYSQVLAGSGCFAHTCGPVPDFAQRDSDAGYTGWTSIGENIAGGYPTPEAVVAGWMASPGHRANILSVAFTEIGIGVTSGGGRYGMYWTQEFGVRQVSVNVADAGSPDSNAGAATADPGAGADTDSGDDGG